MAMIGALQIGILLVAAAAQTPEPPGVEAVAAPPVPMTAPGRPPPVADRVHPDPVMPGDIVLGLGLRTALATGREGTGIDTIVLQPRFAARVHERASFEATVQLGRDYRINYPVPPGQTEVQIIPVETNNVLDAVAKLQLSRFAALWLGRFTPPSDRQTMSGPFLQTAWNSPRTVYRYPSTVAGTPGETSFFTWGRELGGRDEGVAVWGEFFAGALKYHLGQFNLHVNPTKTPRFSGRVTANFWDPEPGYYAQGGYLGERNVLALGAAAQYQQDVTFGYREPVPDSLFDLMGKWHVEERFTQPRDLFVWNVDLLMERRSGGSVYTVEGAFYAGKEALPVYEGAATIPASTKVKTAYSALGLVAWVLPWQIGPGRVQPMFRWQQQLYDITRTSVFGSERFLAVEQVWTMDAFINYIITGYDLRVSIGYQQTRLNADERPQFVNVGFQMQI